MINKPLITIITVCYNSENFIRETIESVLNQTYDNIEYIVVDGNSTDNTLNIIKEYETKFNGRMKWISEPDDGIYDAMNKGIDYSKGCYLYFLNSGDYFIENDIITKIMIKSNTEDFIYGPVKTGKNIRNNKVNSIFHLIFKTITHQGIIASKKCFVDNKFDQNYKWLADYEWIIKCFKNEQISKLYINDIFCFFDPNNNTGITSKKLKSSRLSERKEIGLDNFNHFYKFIFILNQIRLIIKFKYLYNFF